MAKFSNIEDAIKDYHDGKVLIVIDDEDRENEGDFVCAAEKASPEIINFMITHGRGLVCIGMTAERLAELKIAPMVHDNTSLHTTAFTVSVDAVKNTTTGISAHDRAETVRVLVDEMARPDDLGRPGHIFPLKAAEGGVLSRAGHTEAVVDLAKLAGLKPAGVLCEVMNDDGSMARVPHLEKIADKHNIKMITIRDLIAYRCNNDHLIRRVVSTNFPTRYGEFILHLYESAIDNHHHLAIVKGDIDPDKPVLVRVHSECLTGDVFGSMRCDCGDQLATAMKHIEKEGNGILLYMRQEGRGIGLDNKLKAYSLQDEGADTVEANEALGFPADVRDYGIGAQILAHLGAHKLRLLTNNPKKLIGLEGYGLEVVERVPLEICPNHTNAKYLETKRDKLGHLILNDWVIKDIK
ncbi:bifunctional 3,4-dihydroxy-2-butanone-4-phosphate synthase/GTP cyclohydrolase II [bacterium]|nr:bifunctional 3,4-dihydroxy-2-butanone-4-phosphate synthase/GTP cyclohydrolase II [bacterium]